MSKSNQKEKEEQTTKEDFVYKYSNRGLGQLRESVIIVDKEYFMKYNQEKGFVQLEEKILDVTPNLRPPTREEYPYFPYEFATITEPQQYLVDALKETPDSLLAKIKVIVKQFNKINDKTATLLSTYILGSYFQDRFSTIHYIIVIGANGTGKSVFGDTFECLGYRAVNVTNATETFWYRMFGTVEYGQVTIIVEEFDRMEEYSQVMSMLKVGYQPNAKVPRMNNDLTKMEFFFPFGFKIMIAEKSPDDDMARGVIDRSFKIKSFKGFPDLSIKEVRNPQGNDEMQQHMDALNHLRKLLLAYRLVHMKDPYKKITTGLDGRDEELCKPILQLLVTLNASQETITEVQDSLQYFLDVKNNRKRDSLEGSIFPIVRDMVIDLHNATGETSISTTDIWEKITGSLGGGVNDKNPNVWYSDGFGRQYRSRVMTTIRDKFGAEKDHKEKGDILIFDIDNMIKMDKIYQNNGKINTELADPLTHAEDVAGGGYTDNSPESDYSERDSSDTNTSGDGYCGSVGQDDG